MKTFTLMAAALVALVIATPVSSATEFHQRQAAAAEGSIDISNVAGSVRVVGWDRNEIEVEGTLGGDVERVEFTVSGDRSEVRVHLPRRSGSIRDGDADLTINVPRGSRVSASTVSAGIHAEGLSGKPELKSVSGDVTVSGTFTAAEVQSVSGAVRVIGTGKDARIRAIAISGDVLVSAMDGELKATSVSGTVKVTAAGIRRADLGSTSGGVVFDAPLVADGRYELGTVSGSVRFVVHGAAKARYELQALSGNIRNSFGPKPQRVREYGPGMALEFEEGRDAEVEMSAVSGTLRLDRK
ncbi:MAG: DUF4097 family beta strand repeat-containing protein [Gammaproteobacteria bacterium]